MIEHDWRMHMYALAKLRLRAFYLSEGENFVIIYCSEGYKERKKIAHDKYKQLSNRASLY